MPLNPSRPSIHQPTIPSPSITPPPCPHHPLPPSLLYCPHCSLAHLRRRCESASATSKDFVRRSSFVVRRSSFVVRCCFVRRRCFGQKVPTHKFAFVVGEHFVVPSSTSVTNYSFKSLTTYGRTSVLWRRRRPRHARAAGFACRKCAPACASACAHVCVCVYVSTGERNGGAMHTMWGTNDAFKPPHTGDIISQWHHSFRRGDAPSQMHGKVTYRERLFAALVGML